MYRMKKAEPTKQQKRQFAKGFWWGKQEHRFEHYTTYFLVVGFLLHITGLLTKRWVLELITMPFFGLALIFRGLAGFAHRMEKHYNDKLRYGRWKKESKK